ncbi:MAG: hypothetical protein AAGF94_16650 [Pseudomonadota bacterium]
MSIRFSESPRIVVASDYNLVDRQFYAKRVWQPARRRHAHMHGRKAWFAALTILYDFDGRMYFSDQRPYHPKDIEEVFPDVSNRWMTDFLLADETGEAPKRYSPKLERLRMIELCCRLYDETILEDAGTG